MDSERLIGANEVAKRLGLSLRTFETLVAERKAPTYVRIGRIRKWREADITAWIDAMFDAENNRTSAK